MKRWRTLLVLGRVSNLPTVWSNCLAGWWLASDPLFLNRAVLAWLLASATFLYLGGMYLNDAFDARFDARFRRERPIPSGAISERAVWLAGAGLLLAGLACAWRLGLTVGILATLLAICVIAYDAVHKLLTISPLLMAGCRFLLYVMAGATATGKVEGWPVWGGFALGFYIVGLSYVAGRESTGAMLKYWPCVFLAAPVALAVVLNTGEDLKSAGWLCLVLALWVGRHLRYAYSPTERNVGRTVAGLLAGIVLVDWLAVANGPKGLGMIFIALFLLALFLQRFIPAT